MKKRYADVAVPIPTARSYSYSIPDELQARVTVGSSVLVDFHGRKLVGWVVGFVENGTEKVKPIADVIEPRPMFTSKMLKFFRWLSDYYLSPLGLVIKSGLPGGVHPTERQNCVLVSEPSGVSGLSAKIAAFLHSKDGKAPLKSVMREFGSGSFREVTALARGGYLKLERELTPPKVRPKRARWIRFVREPERMTSRQKSLLAFLRQEGEASISDLRRTLGVDPSLIRRLEKKGVVESFLKEELRDPLGEFMAAEEPSLEPTEEQGRIIDHTVSTLKSGRFGVVLLHGVTGSGKTEIYLASIEKALEINKSAIFLVPEIFLTAQFTSILLSRFGPVVGEYHSALGSGEQYDTWRRIRDGELRVVIGPRSALFVPLPNLGLIIVDEEHERTFKQSDLTPRYNARDTAIVRAKFEKALCILGSATPSLESYHNAKRKKYALFHLPKRIGESKLPAVSLIDMKTEKNRVLSELLRSKIAERLERNEQVILLMNRRGYSNFLQCRDCGGTLKCPSCSVTLTYHRRPRVLMCHYCGFERRPPETCAHCRGTSLGYVGFGTQRVEEELTKSFSGVRILRVDLDTTTLKGSHLSYFRRFKEREADVLLGTQMVAKGFDFPYVTLVGVVSADSALNFPDFRSSERTFQLLTQVAGRDGRGRLKGEVVVQTSSPSYYAIELSKTHAYEDFFSREIEERRCLDYPPFSRLASITMKSKNREECEELGSRIRERLEPYESISILGPAPCVLSRIKGYYRYRMILKSSKDFLIQRVLRSTLPEYVEGKDRRVIIDIDPVDLL